MISIVMPAHNEEGYLEPAVKAVVAGLQDRGVDFEIFIAENGSTDNTATDAEQLSQTYSEVSVLRSPVPDYGRALRAGFLAAGGEFVINFDVDFVDLGFLDEALALMSSGAHDIVVGSKRSPGSDRRAPGRPQDGDRRVLLRVTSRIRPTGERHPRGEGAAPRPADPTGGEPASSAATSSTPN